MDGTSVGLNQQAVWKNIEKFEIEDQKECFLKVLTIFEATRAEENLHKPKK